MKTLILSVLFASLSRAHYAIKELTIDGNKYLARDARLDDWVGAKRIEWSYTDNQDFTWMALNDVTAQGFTCGNNPTPPPLKAYARAGADISIQWTDVPRHHWGPSMSYLGLWTPGQNPKSVNFFKVNGEGYNTAKHLWANEIIIQNGNRNQFKIPSDIKSGLYILRSELLSLHGNGQVMNPGLKGLPQFYTHCFNIEITGNGTATPSGVKFPGGYEKTDPGVNFVLGNQGRYASYPVPGPPVYQGKYDPPVGPKPAITSEQLGTFPPAFEAKYRALLDKMNAWSNQAVQFFDSGKGGMSFITTHQQEAKTLTQERAKLREEATRLGLANPSQKMQNSKIFKRSDRTYHPLA